MQVEPDWNAMCSAVQALRGPVAGFEPAQLGRFINIAYLHWLDMGGVGQWDNERKVRHIRPQDVPDWRLTRPIEIHGTDIYVLRKGSRSEKLGAGAFKEVSLAVHLNSMTARVHATARFDDYCMSDWESDRGTQAVLCEEYEVQSLFDDDDPIVKVFHWTIYQSKDGVPKLGAIQEFCKGGDLYAALEDPDAPALGKKIFMSPDAMLSALLDLLVIQCTLERVNVLHRDIKLENLLIQEGDDGEPQIKLGDFGLSARMVDERHRLQNWDMGARGSLNTVSPEFLFYAGARRTPERIEIMCSPKTDLWSLGVTFYSLLTGDKEWDYQPQKCRQRNVNAYLDRHLKIRYLPMSLRKHRRLCEMFFDVIRAILIVNPKKRPCTIDVLLAVQEWVKKHWQAD